MKSARVLLIYPEPTPYIMGLLDRLAERWPPGTDVLFAATDLSQKWDLPLQQPGTQVLPAGLWPAFRHLWGCVRRTDYRIVHLAGWFAHPVLLMALLVAAWRGIPVTMESDTPLPPQLHWSKRLLKRLLYPLLFRLPAHFLPGGTRQAGYLAHYGVGKERITIARMTVDVAAIRRHAAAAGERRLRIRQHLGLAAEDCVFLYVGRLEPHKGLQELLAAWYRLAAAGGTSALLLVGDGSMYDAVRQAAAANPRIHATGRLSGAVLLDAFVAADVLVLPSRFEPWGLVVNEAMASGLPVIASDRVGCVGDLVIAGETGLVVPAENVGALGAALQQLQDDQALRRRLAGNAASLIADWTLEREAEIIAGSWEQVLQT